MKQQEFLKEKLDFFVDDYRKRRNDVRRKAHLTKLSVVLLGAFTTITVGLREFSVVSSYREWLGVAALLLSAGATTVSAWEGFANYSWRWVHSRHILVRFLQLRDEISFESMDADGLSDAEAEAYLRKMMAVLDNANTQWSDKRGAALDG